PARPEIGSLDELGSGRETKHLAQLRRDVVLVYRDVPLPEPCLGGKHGALVALLRFAQRLFGALPCGHIGRRAGPAQDLPIGVAHTHAAQKSPARLAAMEGTDFHSETSAPGCKELLHRTLPFRPVFWGEGCACDAISAACETGPGGEIGHFEQLRRNIEMVVR